jgi:Rad3-related DNA helicase
VNQKNVEEKIPILANYLKTIMDKHPEENGIVHSGSYWLGQKVWEKLPPKYQKRIKLYSGTQEKINALSYLEDSNTIIMGPSLLEGIDLSENLSRIQVFLKVPYPGISNNLTREKMKHYPEWYKWKAEISVRQGVGRSVRSEKDWAITYFLDGCLSDLSLPEDFNQRIVKIQEIEDSFPGRLFH